MKFSYRLPMPAAVMAVFLILSLPSAAKSQGHGQDRERGQHRRGGQSSVRGGGRSHSDNPRFARGGERRSPGGVRSRHDHGTRESYRGDVRTRDPRSGNRPNLRWRDEGRGRNGGIDGRPRYRDGRSDGGERGRSSFPHTRYCDGRSDGGAPGPGYSPHAGYRHGTRSYSSYRPRHHYYAGSFHRPHFAYRSGFSLGVVIGSVPSYGYRYFDPYCDISYDRLGAYYDHCYDSDHPEVILVLDADVGDPIATCVYRDGDWVVDDQYEDSY